MLLNPWLCLVISGLFEMGWPLGFKLAAKSSRKVLFITLSFISMGVSGYFLYLAQQHIAIGTAYVIWTSIGAIGTFFIGILFFHDKKSWLRFAAITLILCGVYILKNA